MGAFEYTAVDASGRERKGVLEGDTARQVRQLLRDQALLPVEVSEVSQTEKKDTNARFSIRRGVSASDLSLLTRQIATLVRSGLPLEESLAAVSEQTEKPRVRSIVMGVRAKVMEGHALADGLADFPAVLTSCTSRRSPPANSRATSTRSWNASPTTPRIANNCAAAR